MHYKGELTGITPYKQTLTEKYGATSSTGTCEFSIAPVLHKKLLLLGSRYGLTEMSTILAAFRVLLYRYGFHEEMEVEANISVRKKVSSNGSGVQFQSLSDFSKLEGPLTFSRLLKMGKDDSKDVTYKFNEAFKNFSYSAAGGKTPKSNPVFGLILQFKSPHLQQELQTAAYHRMGTGATKAIGLSGLGLEITTNTDQKVLSGNFIYSSKHFSNETIGRIKEHFNQLLNAVSDTPDEILEKLKILTNEEEKQLLDTFNSTYSAYPNQSTIVDLFIKQVNKNPNAVALVFGQQKLTYKELHLISNQIGHYLRGKGVQEGAMIPICMKRSLEMIIGILGILKAGGAYVPIDPEFPRDRVKFILKETKASLLLIDKTTQQKIDKENQPKGIDLEEIQQIINQQPKEIPETNLKPHHLAYVIYTSGSTGKPKGVLVEHAQLVASTSARISYYKNLGSLLLVPSFSFDASVGAIFGSITSGGCLILSSKASIQNSFQLKNLLNQSDTLLCVPSYYNFLLEEGLVANSKLSTVIVGGENLTRKIVTAHFNLEKPIALYNEYGPTEATVWSTVSKIESKGMPITIGSPIANAQCYILDSAGELLPLGVTGELHVSGDGLARGYLNRPDLTSEKFIPNPYNTQPGSTMYKTGDLCYWLPDGKIAYVGRLDDQVKIQGYRIELGEIETAILKNNAVKQVVVIGKELENGNKQLIAYIISNGKFDRKSIISYCKAKLPAYMVPNFWVELDHFPLTPNGKINKQALPDPEKKSLLNDAILEPRDNFEQAIVSIWKRLLNIDRVGVEANFFEIGGDSLLAMRVISSARRELNAELGIKDLFTHPTVSKLAAHLRSISNASILPPILKTNPRPKSIPLSFSQESLWFIDQLEGSVQYHLPIVLKIQGQLDIEALEHALKYIVDRHEIFRTVIQEKDGLKEQLVMDADNWQLSVLEGERYQQEAEIMQSIEQFVQKPFDLSHDFMMRARLIRLENQDHILALVMHHIAFDGWSYSVLIKELEALYRAYPENSNSALVSLPFQYGEFALWQKDLIRGKFIEKKISYWKKKLAGAVALQLPTDYARLSASSTKGAVSKFRINSSLSGKIRAIAKQEGATLFMTLLAAFKVLLYRYSSQKDICVGTVMAGRPQTETEDLIGYFINTLPLRSQIDGKASFTDLLEEIKNTTLDAYANQEVPFERIVAAVATERVANRNPLFQVLFLLQNVPEIPQINLDGANVSKMEAPQKTSKFDLTFSLTETAEGLFGTVEYRTDLYQEQTIDKMMGHYQQLLHAIARKPEVSIAKLNMLTSEEKRRLLISYNNTNFNHPTGKTIIDLFEEQVLKNPNGKALVFEGQQLSYHELDSKSNQLGHFLRNKGVKEETLVLVCIERSLEMVVGILGILKAGAAYVPIDPHYPMERIRYIQEDTGAQLMLSSKESKREWQHLAGLEIIELDRELAFLEGQSTSRVKTSLGPHHLAYVLYTSGSTGTPKGVMIEHRNTYHFVCWCKKEFGSSQFELVYASTSICFDLSVFELFFPLSIGKPIRLIENGLQISKYLSGDSSVLINTVPSVVQNLLQEKADLSRVSVINMAGEPISSKILKKLNPEKIEVRNLYGPTEDTTYSTVYKIDKKKRLLIGKPISNSSIYILSPENELNPEGVPGEICIGGAGVARGYLNREELTSEKFVLNPFDDGHYTKIYKTGDLGRWKPGGLIEYIGRKDEQVKIYGYRIELGEIESALHQFEGVKQAVVVVKPDAKGEKCLVGYVVLNDKYGLSAIIGFLKEKLPHFMIPSSWVKLDYLPLNENGKIDRKALSDSVGNETSSKKFVAPSTELERELARIWEEILHLERIGIHDNFFEVGGHSLLANRIIFAVREKIKVELGIRELFTHPTVAELSGWIKKKKKTLNLQSKESVPKARNSLIPIKPTGNKVPIYLVDGEDVNLPSFYAIAKNMDPEQPVFGLQAKGLNGNKKSMTSVEDIASHYIDEILRKNPDGPYILAGYSLGGIIAYEMANQLKNIGKEVKDLIMFDTYAHQSDHKQRWLVKFVNQVRHGIGKGWFDVFLLINHPQVLIRIKKDLLNRKLAKIKLLLKLKREAQDTEQIGIPNITKINEAIHKEARKNYVLSSYDGRIQLLRAKIPTYYTPDSRYYGWKPHVSQVNVWEVEGEHTTMFNPPYDVSLAKTLQSILDMP